MATRTAASARRPRLDATSAAAGRTADLAAALAGAVAGLAGIAVAELIAGIVAGAPSLVIAVGDLMIRLQPAGAKDLIVSLFGTNDKLALNVLILVIAVGLAAGLGVLARHRWDAAVTAFGAVAVGLALAALQEPLTSFLFAVISPAVAFLVSWQVLRWLLAFIPAAPVPADASTTDDAVVAPKAPRAATMP